MKIGKAGRVETLAYDVREVTRTYRSNGVAIRANDSLDLQIPAGHVFGVLGPNGAGKSTLVRQLVGLLRPDAGAITLFGHDVVAAPRAVAGLVAYLAQDEPALAELPVHLAVETTARLRGRSRRDARTLATGLLDELDLGPLRDRPLVRLSGGQRRLACVAAALVGERPVLILDEPTTGLDPVARRSVWSAIDRRRREHGTTVVLVTHNVIEAEAVLDRVAILDRGRVIACDTPGRLKAKVSGDVHLDLVWREEPAMDEPFIRSLAAAAVINGRRWSARLSQADARDAVQQLTSGRAFEALDDFTIAAPSLEDVYLSLGGRDDDLERT